MLCVIVNKAEEQPLITTVRIVSIIALLLSGVPVDLQAALLG